MKKLYPLILLVCLALFPLNAVSGEKVLHAIWEQAIPEPNDLDGWRLAWAVQSDPQNWNPANEIDIDYLGGISGEYTTDFTFISPDGQQVIYVFRMLSYDTSGNRSAWTMAAEPVTIDFEGPPGPTEGKFSIIIKVIPGE